MRALANGVVMTIVWHFAYAFTLRAEGLNPWPALGLGLLWFAFAVATTRYLSGLKERRPAMLGLATGIGLGVFFAVALEVFVFWR